MDASVEDRIVVESERAAQSGRAGVIEEVLAQDPPRFRVRWDDGRTSIFAPSAGVARIELRKRERVNLTDGEAARRYHECTGRQRRPLFVGRRPRRVLPARPLLLLLHLHAEHRRLRLGSQENGVGHRSRATSSATTT